MGIFNRRGPLSDKWESMVPLTNDLTSSLRVVGGIHDEKGLIFKTSFAESKDNFLDFVVGPFDCIEISIDVIPSCLSFNIIPKIVLFPFRIDDEGGMCSR